MTATGLTLSSPPLQSSSRHSRPAPKHETSLTSLDRFDFELDSLDRYDPETRQGSSAEPREERDGAGEIERDADLTEIAVPPPEKPYSSRSNSWENEQQVTRDHVVKIRRNNKREASEDREAFLTETFAPPPVEGQTRNSRELQRQGTLHSHTLQEHPTVEDGANATNIPRRRDRKVNNMIAKASTIAWLVFFSLLGTLARLGVEAITTYPNTTFSSTVLWANMGGSFFLGFLLEDRRLFEAASTRHLKQQDEEKGLQRSRSRTSSIASQLAKAQTAIPLYIGLATGFCGSFTSFSSFVTDVFYAAANSLPPATSPYHVAPIADVASRNGGYSSMAAVGILIIQPSVSLTALKVGAQLALACRRMIPPLNLVLLQFILDPLAIGLGFGGWIGAVLLCIWPPHQDWLSRATLPLVFAPVGCLFRFYISRRLNGWIPSFPLGTFVVNVFGTCIEGMCADLQHLGDFGGGKLGSWTTCAVLAGVMQGFCGCATTVSTWVAELQGLQTGHAWRYGLATISISLGLQVAIMGSVKWTIGFSQPVCLA